MTPLQPGSEVSGYVIEKEVGSGAFASVYRAHHKVTNYMVAIKVISKEGMTTEVARTRLRREIAFLEKMEHPFVAEFFQVIESDQDYYLVMEYVENGNLLNYVNTHGRLAEDQARRYFAQLVSVLEYLHVELKVAHRDLKCENVLLDRYNNIRVIDFGLSNQFSDINPKLTSLCGSPAYAAPEMVKGNTYTHAADIWSAGILLFAIVAGRLPFDDENIQRLLQKVVYTEVRYPSFMTPQLVDLLQKMICKDPDRRIPLGMIKNHPWFSQSEYIVLLDQSKLESGGDEGTAIQKELIDVMTGYGIDCHNLHASLLAREFTELTALYRIIFRQKTMERMKDLMLKVGQQAASRKVPAPLGRPTSGRAPVPGGPARPTPFPAAGAGGQRVLTTPVVADTSARRRSRPVAVRPDAGIPTPCGRSAGAHET
jgi:serine/threonine protein kinase